MFSNSYIFKYAAAMVILVAAILSGAAMLLQPAQQKNIKVEKIQEILKSANIASTTSDAEAVYEKHIIREIAITPDGEEVGVFENGKMVKGDIRAFDIDVRSQLKLQQQGKGNQSAKPVFPLFVAKVDNDTLYIIPMEGTGLWGPIWGNMSFNKDLRTVEGVTFDHKGETPGLGAEISLPMFENQFPGKQIFDDNGNFTSISVVKGGVANSNMDPKHGVDAISGGTITSVGVSNMIDNNLSNYITYIKNHKK